MTPISPSLETRSPFTARTSPVSHVPPTKAQHQRHGYVLSSYLPFVPFLLASLLLALLPGNALPAPSHHPPSPRLSRRLLWLASRLTPLVPSAPRHCMSFYTSPSPNFTLGLPVVLSVAQALYPSSRSDDVIPTVKCNLLPHSTTKPPSTLSARVAVSPITALSEPPLTCMSPVQVHPAVEGRVRSRLMAAPLCGLVATPLLFQPLCLFF